MVKKLIVYLVNIMALICLLFPSHIEAKVQVRFELRIHHKYSGGYCVEVPKGTCLILEIWNEKSERKNKDNREWEVELDFDKKSKILTMSWVPTMEEELINNNIIGVNEIVLPYKLVKDVLNNSKLLRVKIPRQAAIVKEDSMKGVVVEMKFEILRK